MGASFVQEIVPYSSKFFHCLEKAGWPIIFTRPNSTVCKWTCVFVNNEQMGRQSKINGSITHPLYYSRFMLWLKYLQVLLNTAGMLHLFVSLPSWVLRCTLGLLRKFCVLGLRCYCPAGCCGIISGSSQAPVRQLRHGSSAGKSRKALQKTRDLCSFVSTEKLLHISSFHFCLPGWEDHRGSDLPSLPMGNQTEGKVFPAQIMNWSRTLWFY